MTITALLSILSMNHPWFTAHWNGSLPRWHENTLFSSIFLVVSALSSSWSMKSFNSWECHSGLRLAMVPSERDSSSDSIHGWISFHFSFSGSVTNLDLRSQSYKCRGQSSCLINNAYLISYSLLSRSGSSTLNFCTCRRPFQSSSVSDNTTWNQSIPAMVVYNMTDNLDMNSHLIWSKRNEFPTSSWIILITLALCSLSIL